MKILLDTQCLLWVLFDENRINPKRLELITNKDNEIYVSVASLWEIEIKSIKHPNLMPYSYEVVAKALKDTDFNIIPILSEQVSLLRDIINQKIHSDPFDHIILASALMNNLSLLTEDENIKRYNYSNIIK